jgi:hypothetical protein
MSLIEHIGGPLSFHADHSQFNVRRRNRDVNVNVNVNVVSSSADITSSWTHVISSGLHRWQNYYPASNILRNSLETLITSRQH